MAIVYKIKLSRSHHVFLTCFLVKSVIPVMSVKQVKEVENKLLEKLLEKTKSDSTTISLLNYYIKKRAQIELEYSLALN